MKNPQKGRQRRILQAKHTIVKILTFHKKVKTALLFEVYSSSVNFGGMIDDYNNICIILGIKIGKSTN